MKNQFKLHSNWEDMLGHCQITYVRKNDKEESIVYCIQQVTDYKCDLMRCSRDGEPQSQIFPKAFFTFERPVISSHLTKIVNEWIDRHEKAFSNESL